jgi:hypothetical protein
MMRSLLKIVAVVGLHGAFSAEAQNLSIRLGNEIPPEVDTIYERGLGFSCKW